MSAFMVGKEHVDALVSTAVFGPKGTVLGSGRSGTVWYGIYDPDTRDRLTVADADRIGTELWGENLRSIHARYPDTLETEDAYPGPLSFRREQVPAYHFAGIRGAEVTPVQGIKAAHCLSYQSCEHDGWEASWSRRFLEALVGTLTTHLPGYDEAAWEIQGTTV